MAIKTASNTIPGNWLHKKHMLKVLVGFSAIGIVCEDNNHFYKTYSTWVFSYFRILSVSQLINLEMNYLRQAKC